MNCGGCVVISICGVCMCIAICGYVEMCNVLVFVLLLCGMFMCWDGGLACFWSGCWVGFVSACLGCLVDFDCCA